MKIMNYKQMYEKGKAEEQKRILEIIEKWRNDETLIDETIIYTNYYVNKLKAKIKDYPLQSDNRNVKGRKKE